MDKEWEEVTQITYKIADMESLIEVHKVSKCIISFLLVNTIE